jgi:hypothetical protein
MAEETSYYSDQNGVRVTDKRVIVNNITYANLRWPRLLVLESVKYPDINIVPGK